MAKDKKKDIEEIENDEELEEVEDVEEVKTSKTKKYDDEYEEEEELTLEDRILNIEKKANITCILTAIVLVVSFLTLIFVVTANSEETPTDQSTQSESKQEVSTSYDTSMFEEIKGSDIKSLSKGKTIVLWIGRQGCGYCSAYAPVVASVKEAHKLDIKYIDYSKMINLSTGQITDQDSYDAIKGLTGDGDYAKYGEKVITGTPYTLVIKNNKVINALRGYGSESDLVSVLKDAGLIKE